MMNAPAEHTRVIHNDNPKHHDAHIHTLFFVHQVLAAAFHGNAHISTRHHYAGFERLFSNL